MLKNRYKNMKRSGRDYVAAFYVRLYADILWKIILQFLMQQGKRCRPGF